MQYEILPAKLDDIKQIHKIYAASVSNETASWEYDPPSFTEMERRFLKISAQYPYLIAKSDGQILGFAYVSSYRERIGYKFCCENSIYIDPQFKGKGIATALMKQLIEESAKIGLKFMIAVIGDSENIASIELHKKLGFEHVGFLPKIGFKFDTWLDSVIMQLCIAK